MNIRSEELYNLHIPRWGEFPPFELYIEQVIAFLNENLAAFNREKSEPLITPAMVNNYVKNGALHPPVKKKYSRDHLAKLTVICIGKRMLSLSDLSESISAMMQVFEIGEGYNLFCEEVEYQIKSVIAPEEFPQKPISEASSGEIAVMRSLASAVATILVFDRLVDLRRRLGERATRLFGRKSDS